MPILSQDLRYASRQLRRSPAFTLTAILTLGLGLGAAATMYNVVHDVLTAPLPYAAPQQLVGVAFTFPLEKPNDEQNGASADFLKLHARSFQTLGIAEDGNTGVNLSFIGGSASSGGSVAPVQVHARRASGDYLRTFGIAPLLGHTFAPDEDVPNGPHVAMLSYGLWQRSFRGDRSIVGRTIQLDEEPYTVVGVMPESFRDPSTAEPSQLWQPLQLSPKDPGYDGDNYELIGRLRNGVSTASAQAELSALNEAFFQHSPYYRTDVNDAKHPHSFRVWPLAQVLTSNVRTSLLAMAAAVLAVLLIACLNLAGLMTTRGSERARELAVRRALGASHSRLLSALVTEGVLLALSSATLAVIFARIVTPALMAASPLVLPAVGASHPWQTALFVLGVSLIAFVLFSLLPAMHAITRPAASALPGRGGTGMDRTQARFGKILVVAQVALAMLLLSAASLLLGTFLKLQATSPGFVPDHLVVAQVTMKGNAYETTLHKTQFIDRVIARLQRTPGVKRVAAIDGIPLDRGLNLGMLPYGHPERAQGVTELRPTTSEYFRTLNLSLLAGRTFTSSDDARAPRVAVISETAAKQWWPGVSPIGQRVSTQGKDPIVMQVVGVVADTHTNSLAEPHAIMIYMPYQQMPDALTKIVNNWIATSFVMRTESDVPLAKSIEQAVNDADPAMPIANIATMQSVIDKTTAAPQFMSWLATSFAGFALLLTVLGLFGLLSYQVAQRTRELGLRLALGATRAHLLRSVMRHGVMLTAIGLAIGGAASLAMPRLVGNVLGDILFTGFAPASSALSSSSTALFLAATALAAAAVFASYLPARRAAQVEPMEALRAE
jgi:predicted permease